MKQRGWVKLFENFQDAEIIDIVASGADKYDFTPNLLGFGLSVGESGYMEMVFSCGSLYFSTDGIGSEKPFRPKAHKLSIDVPGTCLVGQKVERITKEGDEYTLLLYGCYPIVCSLHKNEGYCDRDYFAVDVLEPDAQLMK